jgi:hypothetical protein
MFVSQDVRFISATYRSRVAFSDEDSQRLIERIGKHFAITTTIIYYYGGFHGRRWRPPLQGTARYFECEQRG